MLYEKIREDLTTAMKERREFDTGVLRMLITAIGNKVIEKRGKTGEEVLTEDEVLDVLRREAKKRKEAAALYAQGGRPELEQTEKKESEFIEKYLPSQMGEDEIEAVVKKILSGGAKGFSEIMKMAMQELKGKADGRVVQDVIKRLTV